MLYVFNTKIRCEYILTDFEQINMFSNRVVQEIYNISSTCLLLPFLLDFGTIPAVWYFLFLILLHVNYVV